MNQVFKTFIRRLVIYFDNILMYSKGKEEHMVHLQQVFQLLREQKLFTNFEEVSIPHQHASVPWICHAEKTGGS